MLTQTLASAAPGAAEAPGGGTFYPDILLKPANRGDFLFSGRGVIRGPYTRAAYEREVKPVFEQLGPVIDSLKLDPDLQSELSSFVLREIEDYATDYANEALRFYRGWDVKADSLGSLLIILNQMRLPKSSFVEFLQTISETTAIGEATSPYLRPMAEKLEKFQFVNRLLVPDKAALPELDKYRAILGRMAADLEGSPGEEKRAAEEPAAAASAPGQGGPAPAPKVVPVAGDFESSLTPLGRLSLAILQDRRDSYLRLARQWLDSVGIEGDDWRRPFLAPIEQAHKLGKADLEAAVKKNWEERVLPQVLPVLLKFPFNQSAEREATPLEIEEALHPNGTFWRTFRKMIAPLCVEEKASWRPLSGTETGFRWPADLFPVVNHLAKLTATLWGPDGSPRPVDLTVQAQPLPLGRGEPKVLVLSFLSCGRASAFGFNQKPEPVGFAWEWWTSPASNVGVQLGDPETDEKSDRAISIGDSMWSFLRLLKRGQLVERDTWSWSLARGGFEDPYRVKFTIRENPWDLFSVPAYQEIIHEAK
jgi:type VI secretion system protein ImpL